MEHGKRHEFGGIGIGPNRQIVGLEKSNGLEEGVVSSPAGKDDPDERKEGILETVSMDVSRILSEHEF